MTQQPGIGHADASVPNPDYAQATTTPIAAKQYVSQHGSFNAGQIVLLNGGANDIFYQVAALQAGAITPTQLQQNIGAAAQQLAGIVQQIVAAGATHVFVSNVPDIGGTPLALQSGSQTTLTQLSMLFNGTLAATLQALKVDTTKYVLLDTFTWQDGILANYKANGFAVSNTDTACNLKAMVQPPRSMASRTQPHSARRCSARRRPTRSRTRIKPTCSPTRSTRRRACMRCSRSSRSRRSRPRASAISCRPRAKTPDRFAPVGRFSFVNRDGFQSRASRGGRAAEAIVDRDPFDGLGQLLDENPRHLRAVERTQHPVQVARIRLRIFRRRDEMHAVGLRPASRARCACDERDTLAVGRAASSGSSASNGSSASGVRGA